MTEEPCVRRPVSCKALRMDEEQWINRSAFEVEGSTLGPALTEATVRALSNGVDSRAVVLVEGISDQGALEQLAERRGQDLVAQSISIVPIGGATNIGHFLDVLGPRGRDVTLAGLCDAAEESHFRRGLERAGFGSNLTRGGMEQLGFWVCTEDLEDELIRSLGTDSVERAVDAEGELRSFRTFQSQPAQRDKSNEEQLRRFMGTRAGRKLRYARLLVDALDLARAPRPMDQVLAHAVLRTS